MLWWKDVATERPMNNEAHVALAAARSRDWLESQPSSCDTSETDIRRHAEDGVSGWNMNLKGMRELKRIEEWTPVLLGSALLLTGTGGGTCNCTWKRIQKREEMRVYLCICLKTWLFLTHLSEGGGEISTDALQNEGDFPLSLLSYMYVWKVLQYGNKLKSN